MRAFFSKFLGLIFVVVALSAVVVAQLAGDALELQTHQLTSIPLQAKLPSSASGAMYCPKIGEHAQVEMQNLNADNALVRAQSFTHESSLQTLNGYAREHVKDAKGKDYSDSTVLNWAASPVIAQVTEEQDNVEIGMPCSPAVSDAWSLVGLSTMLGQKAQVVITNFDNSETTVGLRFTTPSGIVELSIANRILIEPRSSVTLDLATYVPNAEHIGVFVQARSGRVLVHGIQERFDFNHAEANPKMGKRLSYQVIPATMRTADVLFIPAVPEYDTTLSAEQIAKARLEQQAALDKAEAEQAAKDAVEAKKDADKQAKGKGAGKAGDKASGKAGDKDGDKTDGKAGDTASDTGDKQPTEAPDPITLNPNQPANAVTATLVIANPSATDTTVTVRVGDANANPNALLAPIAVPAGTSTIVPLDQISTKAISSMRLTSADHIAIGATVEYDNGRTYRVVPSISEVSDNWAGIATAGASTVLFNPNMDVAKVTISLNSVETTYTVEPYGTHVIELTDVGSFYLLADKTIAMAMIGGNHKTHQDVFIGYPNITGGGIGLTAVRNPALLTQQAAENKSITGAQTPVTPSPTATPAPIVNLDAGVKKETNTQPTPNNTKPAAGIPAPTAEPTNQTPEIEKNIEGSSPAPAPASTDANDAQENELRTPVPDESAGETTSEDIFG